MYTRNVNALPLFIELIREIVTCSATNLVALQEFSGLSVNILVPKLRRLGQMDNFILFYDRHSPL